MTKTNQLKNLKNIIQAKVIVLTIIIWSKRVICLCIGKIPCVCVHMTSGWWSSCWKQRETGCNCTHSLAELHFPCVILIASDGMIKLSETFSTSSSLHVSLSSCLAHTSLCYLSSAAPYTCLHHRRSVVFQQWGNFAPMSSGENG